LAVVISTVHAHFTVLTRLLFVTDTEQVNVSRNHPDTQGDHSQHMQYDIPTCPWWFASLWTIL